MCADHILICQSDGHPLGKIPVQPPLLPSLYQLVQLGFPALLGLLLEYLLVHISLLWRQAGR